MSETARRRRRTALATWAVILVAVPWLALSLPSETFFTGDSGVKLRAAVNALAHPARPLEIPLPQAGGQPMRQVEGFFILHGEHTHAVTSEAFALLTAPFIGAFGIRGVYVLPALGLVLALFACARFALALDARRSEALVVLSGFAGTPFLFYGLEFWEHSLALAFAAECGFRLQAEDLPAKAGSHNLTGSDNSKSLVAAGLLGGCAILLRPEALCFMAALLIASGFHRGFRLKPLLWFGCGLVLALLPLALYTMVHFGTVFSTHVAQNAGSLGDGWLAERARLFREWLVPGGWTLDGPRRLSDFWGVAPLALLAFIPVGQADRRGRPFLWTVAVANTLLVVLVAPNDGGGQWGPRYLLFSYIPLVPLMADGFHALSGLGGPGLGGPKGPLLRLAPISAAFAALTVLCGLWIQRDGYRTLRTTKQIYGHVLTAVREDVPQSGVVLTDLWWLDQVAAAAADRTFLYEPADTAPDVVHRLDELAVPSLVIVRSAAESPDVSAWNEGTCYSETARREIETRRLVLIQLRRECDGR